MNRRLWIAVAFAGAAALTYVLFLRPSDEERIRRQVTALTAAVRIDADEANARVRPLRIQQTFRRVFTNTVQVDVPDLVEDSHGRDELAGMAISAAQTFRDLTLAFTEMKVEIDRPARRAQVTAVATLSGSDSEGHLQRAVRDVTMRLEERDGEWRIAAIATR
jgi:hypothetical protein